MKETEQNQSELLECLTDEVKTACKRIGDLERSMGSFLDRSIQQLGIYLQKLGNLYKNQMDIIEHRQIKDRKITLERDVCELKSKLGNERRIKMKYLKEVKLLKQKNKKEK